MMIQELGLRRMNALICLMVTVSIGISFAFAEPSPSLRESGVPTYIAQAAPDEGYYCLTEIDKELNPYSPSQKTTSIRVNVGGRMYTVSVDNSGTGIQLLDENARKVSEVNAQQYEAGTIEDIKQLSSEMLWVGGTVRDYLVDIGDNPTELFNSRLMETGLYAEPSSAFSFGVRPAQGNYISALNGVWVVGYPKTFWGTKAQKLYLVKARGTTDLTPLFGAASYMGESRRIKGVIVRDVHNRPLFYDGQQVIHLVPDIFSGEDSDKGWIIQPSVRSTESRLFLVSAPSDKRPHPFVHEVLAGGRTREFQIKPPSSGQFWIIDTHDGRLWGKDSHRIYRELGGTFQSVASSVPGVRIVGLWPVQIKKKLKFLVSAGNLVGGRVLERRYYALSAYDIACPQASRVKAPFIIH
jgi:hypothetical protein